MPKGVPGACEFRGRWCSHFVVLRSMPSCRRLHDEHGGAQIMTSGRSHRQCRRLQELSTGGSGCSGAATGLQRLDAVVGSGGEVPFAGATVIDRLACQTVLMDGLVVYPVFTVPLSGEPG